MTVKPLESTDYLMTENLKRAYLNLPMHQWKLAKTSGLGGTREDGTTSPDPIQTTCAGIKTSGCPGLQGASGVSTLRFASVLARLLS